jgi:hypothetical protein
MQRWQSPAAAAAAAGIVVQISFHPPFFFVLYLSPARPLPGPKRLSAAHLYEVGGSENNREELGGSSNAAVFFIFDRFACIQMVA